MHYNLAIIGSDLTARTLAHKFTSSNLNMICFGSKPQRTPDICAEGALDHWTRLDHHFHTGAQVLWSYSKQGYADVLKQQSTQSSLLRQRICANEHEKEEMLKAEQQLKRQGYQSSWSSTALWQSQADSTLGTYINVEELEKKLQTPTWFAEDILSWQTGDPLQITTSQRSITADTCVITDIETLHHLTPDTQSSLLPYIEQWHDFQISSHPWSTGTVFSYKHGAYWGVAKDENTIVFGGAKFLRPSSGMGYDNSHIDTMLQKHLKETLESLTGSSAQPIKDHTMQDCKARDEFPVLGHWGRSGHVFLSLGWGAWGLTSQWTAAQALYETLTQGKSSLLSPQLSPTRLISY